jgi:hypothetical protein
MLPSISCKLQAMENTSKNGILAARAENSAQALPNN